MRCRTVLTRVDAHRTGELANGEKQRLERHLETCPSCNDSRSDVDVLASAVKSLVVAPPRSCRTTVCEAVRDNYGIIEAGAYRVRVAFKGDKVTMIDASTSSAETFRESYASRFGRELAEGEVPRSVRGAVESALEGRKAKLPAIDLSGSSTFERSVLDTLTRIPKGEVRTYEWVAAQIGKPRASRAVGNALAGNPVPLLLPCHRVIPSNGTVGRYAFGSPMKRSLLEAEGVPLDELERLGRKGIRFVGSATTKIFCVPACRDARRIEQKNRVLFHDAHEAHKTGYRACKHCEPVTSGA